MKATPFSSEHYYPLLLASGRDGVLINYDGSNYVSRNGHTHAESHQDAPLGWYKMSTSSSTTVVQPILAAGVQVLFWGAPAEPRMYEQDFNPRTATVSTLLTFAKGIQMRIESFMHADSIWCEKVSVLHVPEDLKVDLAFEITAPAVGGLNSCMTLCNDYGLEVSAGDDFIFCSYLDAPFRGKGLLQASAAFDRTEVHSGDPKSNFAAGIYQNVKEGFCVSRTLVCAGEEEAIDYEKLTEKAALGYDALHSEHKALWQDYFACCDIEIPDQKLKGIYDLCRYIVKSHQHPSAGLITLGMLPYHWRGGIACSYDEAFPHGALLTSGNFTESGKYTDSYLQFAEDCRSILEEHGVRGTSFYGWTACDGQYVRNGIDKFKFLTKFKPMFSAFSIIAMYNEWLYHPEAVTEAHIKVIKDQLLFYTDCMLVENEEVAYIKPVDSGTEGDFAVHLDTMTQVFYAAAFRYAGEIVKEPRYTEIADKMYAALKSNYNEAGMLLTHEGAPYIGGLLREIYLYLPEGNEQGRFLEEQCLADTTPWGLDNDLPFEEYRHWPWNDSKVARIYIRLEQPEKAMRYIQHIPCGCSSHGVLPEKIRLDGYPVNYYYTSPAGLAVSTLNEAFACNVSKDVVVLAGGIAEPWKDFSCRDIRVHGNLAVSFTVKDGKFTELKIRNDSEEERSIELHFNPLFAAPAGVEKLRLKKGECYVSEISSGFTNRFVTTNPPI